MNISQEDYGDAWPLTVPEAILHCERDQTIILILVENSGISYPINGTASGGLAKVRPDLTVRPLEDIWLYENENSGTGYRVLISPLIEDGLKLCNFN